MIQTFLPLIQSQLGSLDINSFLPMIESILPTLSSLSG
jgi:hypothetical protein